MIIVTRDGIGGPPGRYLGLEQEKLRRPAPQRLLAHEADPGIYPRGIGLEHLDRLGLQR
jgi:hypothetical protein